MKLSLATAIALLLAYGAYLVFGPQPANVKIQSQWQANRYVLEKYLRSAPTSERGVAQVVIVGSSLAERLEFANLDGCVYNMALSGESMLTGLEAIVKSGRAPQQVYVEINVPGRKANTRLVERAGGVLPRVSALFHTENMPMNLVFSALASGKKGPAADSIKPGVFQSALQAKRDILDKPLPGDVLESNLNQLSAAMATLEKRGTKVFLFEMPVYAELETSLQAMQVRSAFRKAFPQATFVGYEELARGRSIHTVDGLHLDPSEAAHVASNLQTSFGDSCRIARANPVSTGQVIPAR